MMFLFKFADSKVGGKLFDNGFESPYLIFNSSMVASQCKLEMLIFYAWLKTWPSQHLFVMENCG